MHGRAGRVRWPAPPAHDERRRSAWTPGAAAAPASRRGRRCGGSSAACARSPDLAVEPAAALGGLDGLDHDRQRLDDERPSRRPRQSIIASRATAPAATARAPGRRGSWARTDPASPATMSRRSGTYHTSRSCCPSSRSATAALSARATCVVGEHVGAAHDVRRDRAVDTRDQGGGTPPVAAEAVDGAGPGSSPIARRGSDLDGRARRAGRRRSGPWSGRPRRASSTSSGRRRADQPFGPGAASTTAAADATRAPSARAVARPSWSVEVTRIVVSASTPGVREPDGPPYHGHLDAVLGEHPRHGLGALGSRVARVEVAAPGRRVHGEHAEHHQRPAPTDPTSGRAPTVRHGARGTALTAAPPQPAARGPACSVVVEGERPSGRRRSASLVAVEHHVEEQGRAAQRVGVVRGRPAAGRWRARGRSAPAAPRRVPGAGTRDASARNASTSASSAGPSARAPPRRRPGAPRARRRGAAEHGARPGRARRARVAAGPATTTSSASDQHQQHDRHRRRTSGGRAARGVRQPRPRDRRARTRTASSEAALVLRRDSSRSTQDRAWPGSGRTARDGRDGGREHRLSACPAGAAARRRSARRRAPPCGSAGRRTAAR